MDGFYIVCFFGGVGKNRWFGIFIFFVYKHVYLSYVSKSCIHLSWFLLVVIFENLSVFFGFGGRFATASESSRGGPPVFCCLLSVEVRCLCFCCSQSAAHLLASVRWHRNRPPRRRNLWVF